MQQKRGLCPSVCYLPAQITIFFQISSEFAPVLGTLLSNASKAVPTSRAQKVYW